MPFHHEDSEYCPCGPTVELIDCCQIDEYLIIHHRLSDDDNYEGANDAEVQ